MTTRFEKGIEHRKLALEHFKAWSRLCGIGLKEAGALLVMLAEEKKKPPSIERAADVGTSAPLFKLLRRKLDQLPPG